MSNFHVEERKATPLPEAFRSALVDFFGERASFSRAIREEHGRSETHFAGVLPEAVVYPQSTEEVVRLMQLSRAHRVPIVAFGAGTSLEGNTCPIEGGVTVDLSRMNAVIEVNVEDGDCTVQAGVTREDLNTYLRATGLFFPIDPGANATIGGMASTRASGTNAVRYGTMREAVLSLKVVTPEGRVIRTARRGRKSAAGYDLTRLYVGSEGTLGIITEVTLRLHGIPEAVAAATCGFDTFGGAVDTVVQIIQLGIPIARVEFLDDVQVKAINAWSKTTLPECTTVFFEFHGSASYVQEQVDVVLGIASDNGGGEFAWAVEAEDRSRLWKARHEAYYAALALRPGAVGWPTDVCVPISRLAECIMETKQDLAQASMPAPIVGHVGDGNFHVIFVIDPDSEEERQEVIDLNAKLVRRALDMDGTCTGEHGIGLGKISWLEEELGDDTIDVMRAVKRALDPENLLNPGKIFTLD